MPFVWILIALGLGYFLKNTVWKKRAYWTAFGMFLFFTNSIIFDEFIRAWEVEGQTEASTEEYDIAIVLGGMASFNKDVNRLEFKRGADRILQAVSLYDNGKVKKILISGDSGSTYDDGLDEAVQVKAYLTNLGIPSSDILVESESRNTHENAEYTAQIIQSEYPNAKLLLITSASHMRRARACFRAEGLEFDTYSVDHYTGSRWFTFERLFVPNVDVLNTWNVLTKEVTGYLVYAIMGYL